MVELEQGWDRRVVLGWPARLTVPRRGEHSGMDFEPNVVGAEGEIEFV